MLSKSPEDYIEWGGGVSFVLSKNMQMTLKKYGPTHDEKVILGV